MRLSAQHKDDPQLNQAIRELEALAEEVTFLKEETK